MNLKNYEKTALNQNLETQDNFPKTTEGGRPPRCERASTFEENLLRLAILALALLSLAATIAHACGPFFPNNLLDRGDGAVLSAPVAIFARELARLNLAPGRFESVAATNGYDAQTFDAEMSDLVASLKRAKVSVEESMRIVEVHRLNRMKLREFLHQIEEQYAHSDRPVPVLPSFSEVPGLPDEFADYFAGAVALQDPNAEDGAERKAWERLLNRPAAERKYKSTWAAFMLGKSWAEEDDDKAVEYFRNTRELAKHGFSDSAGLAAAAIGLEARVELRRKHFQNAIELYLEQSATGDYSAVESLRTAASEALAGGGDELASLATAVNTRSVITAYLICGERGERFASSGSPATNMVTIWLGAVEAAGVKDVDSAERFALAAYQEGEFALAQRWVKRARNTPVAQWLQAKLFLRAGKIPEAAALIAKALDQLPPVVESEPTNATEFVDNLQMATGRLSFASARAQMSGELGVLQLSRREFSEALDALLRGGFWADAAYVAERVLTADELKAYVDQNWPAATAKSATADSTASSPESRTNEVENAQPLPPDTRGKDIRYLLARRLTRELRSGLAREYYPTEWQASFDELVVALDGGWNETAPGDQRAKSFFTAACIARTNGMELLGTELEPDWFIHGGSFDWGLTWEDRATNTQAAVVNLASAEEIRRTTQHGADPEVRFHYRYQAAFLAWEAAKLLPDNSDETARVLCTAGTWLKQRDPDTADIFYKALVRRCRKTAIGEQADRMRWFPVLDELGNPKPYQPRLEKRVTPEAPENELSTADNSEAAPLVYPLTGEGYIIQRGDSLSAIVNAVQQLGQPLTAKELLEANPGLDPARLKVGQRIIIPAITAPTIPETSE